jgi:hypothetical protein
VGFIGVATRVSCVSKKRVVQKGLVTRFAAVEQLPIGSLEKLEAHAVGVPMLVVSHVLVAIAGSNAGLAHDDDSGWASIDAKSTTSAYVFVDNEDHMIIGIGAWGDDIDRIGNGAGGKHVNAFPRANVNASFAHDAFGLVDVEKLFGLDALVQVINGDLGQGVAAWKRRHWRRGFGFGHKN